MKHLRLYAPSIVVLIWSLASCAFDASVVIVVPAVILLAAAMIVHVQEHLHD